MDSAVGRPGTGRLAVAVPGRGHSLHRGGRLACTSTSTAASSEAGWLTAEEKALLARNIETEDRQKHEVRVVDAFKSGKVWALCAIYFTLMIGLYGIAFGLPTIVKAFGVKGYLGVGLITAIPYAVAVVGMILLSRHSDRTGERRMHYVLNTSAGAVGLILSGDVRRQPGPVHHRPVDRHPWRRRLDAASSGPSRPPFSPGRRRRPASASSTRSGTWAVTSGRMSRCG